MKANYVPAAQQDYYELLNVHKDADTATINEAYRKLALKYHPDRNPAPDAAERFKEISQAFAVLSDPNKRARYDSGGHLGTEHFSAEDLFGGIDFGELFRGQGVSFGGSVFDHLFGHRRQSPGRGANINLEIVVPLERILRGGEETLRFARPETCTTCQGTCAKAGTSPRTCTDCNGTGRHVKKRSDKGVQFQQITACPACQGRGSFIDEPCEDCQGNGIIEHEEVLSVKIPPGIPEGLPLRVPGHGQPSQQQGGATGDVRVHVYSQQDPRFERRESNLWTTRSISVIDAVLGKHIEVPTLEGTASVTIPPGTQPDTVFRLTGKGLPNFRSSGRGNLYVAVAVEIPTLLTSEQRELYEQLKELSQEQSVQGSTRQEL